MKAAASIKTPAQYLASLTPDRRRTLQTIHDAIVKAAPDLPPRIVYGMIGYGNYHYKYASGREGDWPVVALASQKNYVSLYVSATDASGYLAESNRAELGKVSVARSWRI
jgi:hypothetical protein